MERNSPDSPSSFHMTPCNSIISSRTNLIPSRLAQRKSIKSLKIRCISTTRRESTSSSCPRSTTSLSTRSASFLGTTTTLSMVSSSCITRVAEQTKKLASTMMILTSRLKIITRYLTSATWPNPSNPTKSRPFNSVRSCYSHSLFKRHPRVLKPYPIFFSSPKIKWLKFIQIVPREKLVSTSVDVL